MQATFHTGGPTKTPSQLHISSPKESHGRQAFQKSMRQDKTTVRAELRKTGGKLEGPRKRA